jgi:hypothetical protein
MMKHKTLTGLASAAVLFFSLWSASPAAQAQGAFSLNPATPQPAAERLRSGLAVKYLIGKFNSLFEVEDMATWTKPESGTPLPMLNYNVGKGAVLSNHNTDLVGAFIDGYIRFDQAGTYVMSVQYNDGVRLTVAGEMLHEDPIVAPDRFSPNLEIKIAAPGWYPISIIYYEKKNTATLELYWQPPGADSFVFVPAAAFAHIPSEQTS